MEHSMGTTEALMIKGSKARTDFHLVVLEHNNTAKYNLASPAELFKEQ